MALELRKKKGTGPPKPPNPPKPPKPPPKPPETTTAASSTEASDPPGMEYYWKPGRKR